MKTEVAVSFQKTLPIWWSFIWRATVYGTLVGAALGLVAGLVSVFSSIPVERAIHVATIGAAVGYVPASIFALKQALSKNLASLGE
jgi:uncharacterized membrane protein